MHLFDTASLARALALPLDARLHFLLQERIDHLATLDFHVADTTYFLVIGPGTAAADVESELGWSPLVDLDGGRFGTQAYQPFHDFIADRGGWYEMMVSTSNEAVVILLVKDDPGTDPDLLALCRTHVGEGA